MKHKEIFDIYLKLFESTFDSVYDLDQGCRGLSTVGLAGTDPKYLAHRVGICLMRLRVWPGGDLTKEDGRRFPEDHNRIAHRILRWRDRPIWDEFKSCKVCGITHPDGVNPYTREKVDCLWKPETIYTLYMRFLISNPF